MDSSKAQNEPPEPVTPQNPAKKKTRISEGVDHISVLPIEVFLRIISHCGANELFSLSCTCSRLQKIINHDAEEHWKTLFECDFCEGEITPVQRYAAILSKSYKMMYLSSLSTKKANGELYPNCPNEYEKLSHIHQLFGIIRFSDKNDDNDGILAQNTKNAADLQQSTTTTTTTTTTTATTKPPTRHSSIVFLLDGSGSVSTADFTVMTEFVVEAVEKMSKHASKTHHVTISVVQFSSRTVVEFGPKTMKKADNDEFVDAFAETMNGITPVGAGTHVSLAVASALKILDGQKKSYDSNYTAIAVLTDGMFDPMDTQQISEMMEPRRGDCGGGASSSRENGNGIAPHFFAYGVGHEVHRSNITTILDLGGGAGRQPIDTCR